MLDFYKKLRLSKKVLVAILSVPIIVALVLTVYAGRQVIRSKNTSKETLVNATSTDMLDKIDRNFYERFGDVQAFAYNKLAVDALKKDTSSEDLQNFINTMTNYYVLYDLMILCNAEGKVIAVNTQNKSGKIINSSYLLDKNFSSEVWFKTCMSPSGPAGGAWYSDFCVNHSSAQINNNMGWGMAFAAPVKNESGTPIGVWYNFANWQEVTRKIRKDAERSLNNAKAFIFITNTEGTIIDAEDSLLIASQKKISENSNGISIGNMNIYSDDYMIGQAVAKGAYTYKGKNWKAITLVPKSQLTFATFFSKELIGLLIFDIICLSIATYIGYTFSRSLSLRIYNMKGLVEDLSKGKLSKFTPDGVDEINEMGMALNTLSESLKTKVLFAEAIGKRSFSSEFKPSSDQDLLGISLINMRNNLNEYVELDQKRSWATQGLAKFADILRAQIGTKELANRIISETVKYVQANQGALFLLHGEKTTEQYLELEACYAYDRKKYFEKKINLGEGLVGQCVLEKEHMLITEIPQNHIQITSGLGLATPNCLFIMPLKANEEVLGVIELASFSVLDQSQIDFLLKLSESIATTLAAAKTNETTQKLLYNAQLLTEQMKAQEEEIRQNMEELSASQEELLRKQEIATKQTLLLDSILSKMPFPVFVKDQECKYILANEAQAILMGMPLQDLLNKSDEDFITDRDELKQIKETDLKILQEGTMVILPAQQFTIRNSQPKILQTYKIPFTNPISGAKNILGTSVEIKASAI